MISTRNLDGLPDTGGFLRLTRSIAMLDAILSPEWQYRYYSFNSHWAAGEMMASMRDGSGDQWCASLSDRGIGLVGSAHEAPMYRLDQPWPGIFSSVPESFADVVAEPAFDSRNATFFIWRTHEDSKWSVGPIQYPAGSDPDGSAELLSILDSNPSTYRDWAESYYERSIDLAAVRAIYHHEPLGDGLLRGLNPALRPADLAMDLKEIGYPGAARRNAGQKPKRARKSKKPA